MKRFIVLVCFTACTLTGDDGSRGVRIETLPGGATRVISPGEGIWRDEEVWRLTPELVIGVEEGVESEMFAQLVGLEVGPDGRIYVLDRQLNELRIFGPDGRFITSVGRTGGGPGEYRNANGLLWLATDTLAVLDQRGGRISLHSAEGAYLRSVPRRHGFYSYMARTGYARGHVYEMTIKSEGEVAQPVFLGTPVTTDSATMQDSTDAGGVLAQVDTVLLPSPAAELYESFSVRTESAGMVMQVPFTVRPVYQIDAEGHLWHGHGKEFRIARSTLEGDTLIELVVENAAPNPVTPEELAEWESNEFVSRFKEIGGKIDHSRIPTTKGFFDNLHPDTEGYLWVTVPAAPMESAFGVFDPEGRFLGRLTVDGVKRDANIAPVVRNGRLHFIGRDVLDVQRVYVFRVEQ